MLNTARIDFPLSVTIRYFPALKEEMGYIRDAVKLRNIYGMQRIECLLVTVMISVLAVSRVIRDLAAKRCIVLVVSLSYNDFHIRHYDSEFKPDRNLFCIDHCREGRLEYPVADDAYSYVEAGDLKLDRRLTHTGHLEMPFEDHPVKNEKAPLILF